LTVIDMSDSIAEILSSGNAQVLYHYYEKLNREIKVCLQDGHDRSEGVLQIALHIQYVLISILTDW